MKIFITGEKGIGKSTCIQNFIKKCHIKPCGFVTLPFYEKGIRKGFYMHSLVDVEENDMLFSIQKIDRNLVIKNIFNDFGVYVLQESLKYQNYVMIIDEIGYLESTETKYINTLLTVIDTHPNILGVLKKHDQDYITKIKNREDVMILDMDQMGYEEVEKTIIKEWENENA